MNDAIMFALLSLACAGLTDIVFKYYSSIPRSRGLYVVGMGAVWTVLQAAIVAISGHGFRFDPQTLAFGLGAGVLVALSNTLLIESLGHIDVSLASTIYRLNTIAVVILAVLLLAEPLTLIKLLGVMLGIAAVGVLFESRPSRETRQAFVLFFVVAVTASLLRAGFGIITKAAVLHGVDLQTLLLVNAPVWMLIGGFYAFRRERHLQADASTLAYSLASGTLICGVANFLMLALARGDASIVVPIANMSFIVAILIAAALGMERLSRRKYLAVGLAVGAIAVLARA